MPEDKYPLVSRGSLPTARDDKVLSLEEWRYLSKLVNPDKVSKEENEEIERNRRRKQDSLALQRSWGQTGKVCS